MGTISLDGLDKAEVLAALYNASRPLGIGFLSYSPEPMTRDEAAELLSQQTYFDYLKGRVMKVDLGGNELDPWGYDRDNGSGAAQEVINALCRGGPNDEVIETMHYDGKRDAIENVRQQMHQETTITEEGDVAVMTLGLSGVADVLGPAVDKAERG